MSQQKNDSTKLNTDVSQQKSDSTKQKIDVSQQRSDRSQQRVDASQQKSDKSQQRVDTSQLRTSINIQKNDKPQKRREFDSNLFNQKLKDAINNPEKLKEYFSRLERETEELNRNLRKGEENLISAKFNIDYSYLYFFQKIIDKIDEGSISNPEMTTLFFNILSRSKTFLNYIQKNFKVSRDKVFPLNKEIFLKKYMNIGNYVNNSIIKHTNMDLSEKYKVINSNVTEKIVGLIQKFLRDSVDDDDEDDDSEEEIGGAKSKARNRRKPRRRYRIEDEDDQQVQGVVDVSNYLNFMFSLFVNQPMHIENRFLGIETNIDKEDFRKLKESLSNKAEVLNPEINQNGTCILFSIEKSKCKMTYVIENKRDELHKCNVLGSKLFEKPEYLALYISIKEWANNRDFLSDYSFTHRVKMFKESQLLYFTYFYLMKINEIQPLPFLCPEKSVIIESLHPDPVCKNLNDSEKKSNGPGLRREFRQKSQILSLGILFVNFFYFLLNLCNRCIYDLDKSERALSVYITSKTISALKRETLTEITNREIAVRFPEQLKDNSFHHKPFKLSLVLNDFINPDENKEPAGVYSLSQMKTLREEVISTLISLLDDDMNTKVFGMIGKLKRYRRGGAE